MSKPIPELIRELKGALPVLAVVTILLCIFWGPALLGSQSLIHGESILHSLSLWEYHARSLRGELSPLWSHDIYGGHPLFAESQGNFANPISMLLAATLPPFYANNFAHWLTLSLAGIAIYALCRVLGISRWAAGFAALATLFSSAWIHAQNNMTFGGAMIWVPWVLLATELWLRKPSVRSAAWLGIAVAFAIVAGYPQLLHGALLYVLISLLPTLFNSAARSELLQKRGRLLSTGAIAVLIGLGLSAVQLLPLLELTLYSHRANGTVEPIAVPLSWSIRGYLFNLHYPQDTQPPIFLPAVASLYVCLLASSIVFFRPTPRIAGHIAATLAMIVLGFSVSSPIVKLLYHYHLIPGLHYFRVMTPYINVAIIGISVLAAAAIDKITVALQTSPLQRPSPRWLIAIAIWIACWVALLDHVWTEQAPWQHFAIVVGAVIGAALLARGKKAAQLPLFLFALLVVECSALKLHEFHFGATTLLGKPDSVNLLKADPALADFKVYDASTAVAAAMGSPLDRRLEYSTQRIAYNLIGLANTRWDIATIEGALALPLNAWSVAKPAVAAEINGGDSAPPGLRLVDILGIKYVFSDAPLTLPSFTASHRDATLDSWININAAAKPRFQSYGNYALVASPQAALSALHATTTPLLVLEKTAFANADFDFSAVPSTAIAPAMAVEVIEQRSTHYLLSVDAARAGWLFFADANYPGWRASIDGDDAAIFSAQILGKAIYVPAGRHRVVFDFVSNSFRLGLTLTALTLTVLATLAIVASARRRCVKL